MATATEIIARLEAVNIELLAELAIEDTAKEFGKLNTEQMEEGKDSKDQKISPGYRSSSYARMKNQMNPKPGMGVPDLKLTGAFYKGYRLQVINGEVIEDSDVPYAPKLEKQYGKQIWGLDPENKRLYIEKFLSPGMKKRLTEETGLR